MDLRPRFPAIVGCFTNPESSLRSPVLAVRSSVSRFYERIWLARTGNIALRTWLKLSLIASLLHFRQSLAEAKLPLGMVRQGKNGPRAQPRDLRPVAPKAKAAPRPPAVSSLRRRRAARKSGGYSMMHALDARMDVHVPASMPSGPYAVIRTRDVIPDATNAVYVFGAYRRSDVPDSIVPTVGLGAAVSSAGFGFQAFNLHSAWVGTRHSLRLHSLTVEIAGTGSALNATGMIRAGTFRSKLDTSITSGTVGAWFETIANRPEITLVSSFNACQRPLVFMTAPLDHITWNEYRAVTGNPALANDLVLSDGLMPIVVSLPAGAGNAFTITVHTEWAIIYANDVEKSSLMESRPSTGNKFWERASSVISDVSGYVDKANRVAGAVASGVRVANTLVEHFIPTVPRQRRRPGRRREELR